MLVYLAFRSRSRSAASTRSLRSQYAAATIQLWPAQLSCGSDLQVCNTV